MTEWMLFLTMIRAEHGKPVPPRQPAAIVLEQTSSESKLTIAQRQELRAAVEKLALQSTGKLVHDKDSGLFGPEADSELATREAFVR